MSGKISDSPINQLCDIARSEEFNGLQPEIQGKIIEELSNNGISEKDGGVMGKLFGTKKENASMNIAVAICLLLSIIGVVCMALGNNYWDVIIPGIMTSVGYIFGKGER